MGKARHPHNADRPESAAVRRALEKKDIEALRLALTPRQRAFAHEYVVDFNGAAAVVRAGYSPKYADRQAYINLHHKGIATLIDHLTQSKAAKTVSINPDYVIQRVTEIINKDEAKDGDKLRGLELLARHLGMLTDRQEISGDLKIDVEKKLAEEEAAALMNQLRRLADRKKDIDLV